MSYRPKGVYLWEAVHKSESKAIVYNNAMKKYWVYMMQSANGRVLYTGVTNNLIRRVVEHKEGKGSVFTAKYKCHKLVYFEEYGLIDMAIIWEKTIKKLSRANKEKLIDAMNPERVDLFEL